MEKLRLSRWKSLLFCVTCYAAIFNLETSPFRYFVPSHPFSECLDNQLRCDLYIYLYNGNLITQGLMPYRDSFDHKGPILYLIMAAGILIGRVAGVWLVQTLLLAVSAYYAYRTALLAASRPAAALAASVTVLWCSAEYTSPETLSVPFVLATLYYFVRYIRSDCRIRRKETFLVGICFGAVVLMKVNLAALWAIFIAAVTFRSAIKKEYRLLLGHAAVFLLGTALVAAPVLYWLRARGAFTDFIADYWLFNTNSYGGTPSLRNYLSFFCPWAKRAWISYQIPALTVYLLLCFKSRSARQRSLCAWMAAYLVLSVLFAGIKGTFLLYYVFSLTGAFIVFFAIAFDYILRQFKRRRVFALLLFAVLMIPIYRSLCVPPVREAIVRRSMAIRSPDVDLERLGRPIRTDRDALDAANWLRENTKPDATITGVGAHVYWYARRNCAAKYSFSPARQSYQDTFPVDKNGNIPEYVFELRKWEYSYLRDMIHPHKEKDVVTSPEIEKTLAEKYEKVYSNGSYDLYRRKD